MEKWINNDTLGVLLIGCIEHQHILAAKLTKYLRWKGLQVVDSHDLTPNQKNVVVISKSDSTNISNQVNQSESQVDYLIVVEIEDQRLDQSTIKSKHYLHLSQQQQVTAINITGFIQSKIMEFLTNCNYTSNTQMKLYITRHGQSVYNTFDKIGGDSGLSHKGKQYVTTLNQYLNQEFKQIHNSHIAVISSQMKRTLETKRGLDISHSTQNIAILGLNELDVGICEGMSYDQIEQVYPLIKQERDKDKLRYRYPEGESYFDMICRLDDLIFHLEKTNKTNLVIIGHQGNLRCLLGYLQDIPLDELPHLSIPLHQVRILQKRKDCYQYKEDKINLDLGDNVGSSQLFI